MLKKQIMFFVLCTLISVAMIVLCGNSAFALFFMPLVFTLLYSIETVKTNGYFVALTFAINLAVSILITKDLFESFIELPLIIASGVLVGISAVKNLGKYPAILGGMLATGGVYAAYIIYSTKLLGINPVNEMFEMMKEALMIMTTYGEAGIDLSFVNDYIALCKNMFAGVMVITFTLVGYLVAYISAWVLGMFKTVGKLNLTFAEFKADGVTLFVYFITLIGSLFVNEGVLSVTLTNIYIILNFYLVICGASSVYYLIKNKINAPVIIKRLLGILVLFVSAIAIVSSIFVLIAIIDARRDFRRLNKQEE